VNGAGDRDRTGDIQLGKLKPTLRSTQNQAHRAGYLRSNAALSSLIEHHSEHKYSHHLTPRHSANELLAYLPTFSTDILPNLSRQFLINANERFEDVK
jgi:hypothetical protein